MKTQNDPWDGGLHKTTVGAQSAFDAARPASDEQIEWCEEYHGEVATVDDIERIGSLDGDEGQVIAWYWETSYRAR